MDRGEFIRKLKRFCSNNLHMAEGIDILMNYCIDNGKDVDLSYQFICTIANTLSFTPCLETAISHYERKFEIVKVYNRNKDTILLIF